MNWECSGPSGQLIVQNVLDFRKHPSFLSMQVIRHGTSSINILSTDRWIHYKHWKARYNPYTCRRIFARESIRHGSRALDGTSICTIKHHKAQNNRRNNESYFPSRFSRTSSTDGYEKLIVPFGLTHSNHPSRSYLGRGWALYQSSRLTIYSSILHTWKAARRYPALAIIQ